MKELKVVIDGVTHEYTKIPIAEKACDGCSLQVYCRLGFANHLCKTFDLSGKCRPIGSYGHFKIVE